MELAEAIDVLVARTGHERFRDFINPEHPDYAPAWEAEVIRLATNTPDPRPPAVISAPPFLADRAAMLKRALEGWYQDALLMFRYELFGEEPPKPCCGGSAAQF